MNRDKQLMESAEEARKALIRHWCEVAALNATEAGTLFGYYNHREGKKMLMKAMYANQQIKQLTNPRRIK